jgi:Ca2+-binding RTX toxin-like protein
MVGAISVWALLAHAGPAVANHKISEPVPAEMIVTKNGLEWVWASPCAMGSGCTTGILVGKDGFNYATQAQWAQRPAIGEFGVPMSSPTSEGKCATPWFDASFEHCDGFEPHENGYGSAPYQGTPAGDSGTEPMGAGWETWLVRDASADLCFGQPATITGSGTVNGTPGDDVIITGNGNDTVDGLGGNDRICTRGGDDHARGGTGNDQINSGNGNDNTGGQAGNDLVQSTGGNDDLQGGDGDDRVQGGEGNDTLNGGDGSDAVEGQGGNDLLAGNAGAPDTCDGGAGTDATSANGGCETSVGIP